MSLHHGFLREGGADLQGFVLAHANQLLVEVYDDHLLHNDGTHLDREVAENTIWQRLWQSLVARSVR